MKTPQGIAFSLVLISSSEYKVEAFQMWCCRRILCINWTQRRTNESVLQEIGENRSILTTRAVRVLDFIGSSRFFLEIDLSFFGFLFAKTKLDGSVFFIALVDRVLDQSSYKRLEKAPGRLFLLA